MRTIAILIATMLLVAGAFAAPPKQINYQGKLTDDSGIAVNDTLEIGFSLWNAETGGDSLWGELDTVIITKGLFDVILGDHNPIDLEFSDQAWVALDVAGERLSPRQPLSSVPSAFRASVADSLVGGVILDHNDLSGLQGGAAGEYYHLTNAQVTQISTNQTNIGDLTYTEDNFVTDGEDLTSSVDALDQAVSDIGDGTSSAYIQNQNSSAQSADFWIDGNGEIDGTLTAGDIAGQGSAEDDISSTVSISDPAIPVTLTEVNYTSGGPGSKIHLSFSGTFDDRGGQDGAYVLVEIVRDPGAGETVISQANFSIYSPSVYQLQTVSINGVDTPPAGTYTYRVRAKVVKEPYTSGRCLSGALQLAEIKE